MAEISYPIIDFSNFIVNRTKDFTGREWVFNEIDRWLADPNGPSFFIITGEPGVGKSAISARLTQIRELAAYHFCIAREIDTIDPFIFARSLSLQLSRIDGFALGILKGGNISIESDQNIQTNYGQAIGVQINNLVINAKSGSSAFTQAVLQPLKTLFREKLDGQLVILVDALDEAVQCKGEETIIDLLASAGTLPHQVRFILTSRPEGAVLRHFEARQIPHFRFDAARPENLKDIRLYIQTQLAASEAMRFQLSEKLISTEVFVNRVTTASQGNFLYVIWLLPAIAAGTQGFDTLDALPQGLDSIYREFLRTRKTGNEEKWQRVYEPILGVLAVAQAPLNRELVSQFTGLTTQEVRYGIQDLRQFLEPTSADEGRYFLYHQSIMDWLKEEGQSQEFWVDVVRALQRIVENYRGATPSWDDVDWRQVDDYGLRYLATHLYTLRNTPPQRKGDALHSLLESRSFINQHLAVLGQPNWLLNDLRLALNLALENDDLAQAWRHIRENRRVTREQLDFERLLTAVEEGNKTGDYGRAIERTALYGYMPNSQALAKLWIAWNAATSGHATLAESIVKGALERLPPRGTANFDTQRAGIPATIAIEGAIGVTLQRLLIRIAQAAKNTVVSGREWLRGAMSPWPEETIDATGGRLSEPLNSWGELFEAKRMNDTMEELFQQLQARGGRLDADSIIDRDPMYFFQSKLAAGLFNSRHDPAWLEQVKKTVALIKQDDYPSYREVALAWVASAVLAQEDPALACQALATVLGGMFRPSPGFWGDTVASAMDGMNRENNQGSDSQYLLFLLEHVEATGERGIDPNVYRKMPSIMEWRRSVGLPEDPWSFSMRRKSAVAAVMHRRGDVADAEALLQEASSELSKGSYAGYRALARLSLACRLLEWRCIPKAVEQAGLAQEDAYHVLDDVLRQERVDLVDKMRRWITDYGQNAILLSEDEALVQLQQKTGLERGLFIEFLSALWSDNAASLKRLLPLALDDATTADAVLGRLLAVEALQARPGRPFLELVKALKIDTGIEK